MSSETTAGDWRHTPTRTFLRRTTLATAQRDSDHTIEDTTAPEFTSVPADYIVECSDEMPMDDALRQQLQRGEHHRGERDPAEMPLATTRLSARSLPPTPVATALLRRRSPLKTRQFELSIPARYTAECSDELILDDATATDNRGEVTIEVSSETTAGDCDGSYTLTRTFTATDDAGNSRRHSNITAEDTTAPEFMFLPTTRRSALTRCPWTTQRQTTAAM